MAKARAVGAEQVYGAIRAANPVAGTVRAGIIYVERAIPRFGNPGGGAAVLLSEDQAVICQ